MSDTLLPAPCSWVCRVMDACNGKYWQVLCRLDTGREEEEINKPYVVIEMPNGQWFVAPNRNGAPHDEDIGPYDTFAKAAMAAEMLITQESEDAQTDDRRHHGQCTVLLGE